MDWLTKIWNSIKTTLGVSSSSSSSTPSVKSSKPIFNGKKTTPRQGKLGCHQICLMNKFKQIK